MTKIIFYPVDMEKLTEEEVRELMSFLPNEIELNMEAILDWLQSKKDGWMFRGYNKGWDEAHFKLLKRKNGKNTD